VDLRSRTAFAAGHLRGSLNFGSGSGLATYLGWLIPWGTPLTLIGASPQDVADAQRELCRIGIDAITAAASWPDAGLASQPLETYRTADFGALAAAAGNDDVVVVDVRRSREWQRSHLQVAMHIPLHELPARLGQIPDGVVWVHCEAGYRAAVAASMLAAQGRRVVAVDDQFAAAEDAGLATLAGPLAAGQGLGAMATWRDDVN
jgi:rhodanese-related sulfurtransferase